ncbi:CsgG/HfaB family protein [Cognatishimia sp. MH4019]|uniref:CsgG/HfaB family protein n=1 Tax=Cognatishimia sp. MH4019 TaxID=2854030 RepID=UPI001CD294A2|nr:CsgG/HfaB family protein [Cognatishimia sp. MH4019]
MRLKPAYLAVCAAMVVSGCDPDGINIVNGFDQPTETQTTRIGGSLALLPPPRKQIDIAVYAYDDQTGQQKPEDNFSSFSKAVTQGGEAILIDVLKDVSGGRWFNVVERAGLQNLLTERQLIDQSNQTYRGTTRSVLPPLRFAGIILEGGIVNYDSNVKTGGIGARYLGIGMSTKYRQDIVTVALRTVSVSSGEVLSSVTTEKTVYSTLVDTGVFRFVGVDELLEIDAGTSVNEPVGIAVRQAMELAVYSLIVDGAARGIWDFKNRSDGRHHIESYRNRGVVYRPQSETDTDAQG